MVREYAVIGLGRFGTSVALTLQKLGHNVLGIDTSESKVQSVANELTHVVQADASDENVLRSLGIRNFDTVVVAIGQDMEASILITLMLKEIGVRTVVAKAATEAHGKVLQKVGADRVVFPEKDMGTRIARFLSENDILDYIELTPQVSIVEFAVSGPLVGKNLRELNLRAKFHVTALAIRRGDQIILPPSPEDPIRREDILVVIGSNDDIDRLQKFQEKDK